MRFCLPVEKFNINSGIIEIERDEGNIEITVRREFTYFAVVPNARRILKNVQCHIPVKFYIPKENVSFDRFCHVRAIDKRVYVA